MFSQRFGDRPDQVVHSFSATDPGELAKKISKYVETYHARIVAIGAYSERVGTTTTHYALVTFERTL
jgi:hypothetical protein